MAPDSLAADASFAFECSANPVAAAERAERMIDPGFGRVFTDHMATAYWSEARGWYGARVHPRQTLTVDPASSVLHYAQEIFEGLKAYRLDDDGVALFRPYENAARFRNSARRMAMPELPDELFVGSLERLVRADAAWIPTQDGASLYLRPFMVASEAFLGVRPAGEYLYMALASSVGSYWKGGVKALSLWVSHDYSRAAPGGTGAAKCGGNYAASLVAQVEATRRGCDQVVFLDATERRWIEELGGMNIFFVFDDGRLRTPPLTGTILPGITRDSILTLARAQGLTVEEESYALDDWRSDAAGGRLVESFACGTAAVVTPIGQVSGPGYSFQIGSGGTGQTTAYFLEALTAIQRGRAADPHGWLHRLD